MYFALVTGHFHRAIPDPKNAEVGNDATCVLMLDRPRRHPAGEPVDQCRPGQRPGPGLVPVMPLPVRGAGGLGKTG